MSKIRDEKTKKAFIEFLNQPGTKDLRFWQALAAFWGKDYILLADSYWTEKGEQGWKNIRDTFFIEADEARKEKNAKSNIN